MANNTNSVLIGARGSESIFGASVLPGYSFENEKKSTEADLDPHQAGLAGAYSTSGVYLVNNIRRNPLTYRV